MRVQHRFGGIQHESKNGGRMQMTEIFIGGCGMKIGSWGQEYAPFCGCLHFLPAKIISETRQVHIVHIVGT